MLKVNESTEIIWHGHASLEIKYKDKLIFIDPVKIKDSKADLILITHSHFNHFSMDDIEKIRKDHTILAIPKDLADNIDGGIIVAKPGIEFTVYEVSVETTPAYNLSGKPYHPKSREWVGYILNLSGLRIYHSGDTDDIPEMKRLKVDVAFLPVSGRSVMNAKKAASIANKFKPGFAVPIHWDNSASSIQDAAIFKKYYKGETKIIRPLE